MANSTVTVPTVKIEGAAGAAEREILTPQATRISCSLVGQLRGRATEVAGGACDAR